MKDVKFCIIVLSIAVFCLGIGMMATNKAVEKANQKIISLESYLEYLYEEEENE